MKYESGIKISSIEDIKNLKSSDTVEFKCIQCGKITRKKVRTTNSLLCYNCKRENTSIKKFGKSFQEQCRDAREKTFLTKYGVKSIMSTDLFKEKSKQTLITKYGVDNSAKSPLIQEKIKQTNLKIYGVSNVFQSELIKEKIKKTNLKKYGVENPGQNYEIRSRSIGIKKPFYKNIRFDSKWELAFWIYCEDHNIKIKPCNIKFKLENNSYYFPDFIINENDVIEIKSNYILKYRTPEEKLKCIKENNIKLISNNEIIKYIDYIYNQYGKKYLNSFYDGAKREN